MPSVPLPAVSEPAALWRKTGKQRSSGMSGNEDSAEAAAESIRMVRSPTVPPMPIPGSIILNSCNKERRTPEQYRRIR